MSQTYSELSDELQQLILLMAGLPQKAESEIIRQADLNFGSEVSGVILGNFVNGNMTVADFLVQLTTFNQQH